MSTAPRRPPSSVRGDHAELTFASRVTELGWIWHPVLSGRDVGIDGRVELVAGGSVTSDEFTVQIKSGFDVTKSGEVRVAGVKLSTIGYWQRKLPPTLLVALDPDSQRFAFQWAHSAIGSGIVSKRLAAGEKTTSLSLSAFFSLDDPAPWEDIESYLRQYFRSLRSSLQGVYVHGAYTVLYLQVCDVIDLLVDWRCWIAYADPSNVIDRFVDADDREYPAAVRSFEDLRISPGDDEPWRTSIAEPAGQLPRSLNCIAGFLTQGKPTDFFSQMGPWRRWLKTYRDS